MKIGVIFPQLEIGADPALLRDYAQTAEGAGMDHIAIYDHVLGADTAARPDFKDRTTRYSHFHEPLVLFGYLAALTQRIEFCTSVIIAPQRQTALLAKQAAEVDVLSGGRLRLGLGTGWNDIEYEGLNENFHNRGRRLEEQITVLRQLWTEPVITVKGKYHTITAAGIESAAGAATDPDLAGRDGGAGAAARRDGGRRLVPAVPRQRQHRPRDARSRLRDGARGRTRPAEHRHRRAGQLLRRRPGGVDSDHRRMARTRRVAHLVQHDESGLDTPAAHMDAIRRFAEAVKVAG